MRNSIKFNIIFDLQYVEHFSFTTVNTDAKQNYHITLQ